MEEVEAQISVRAGGPFASMLVQMLEEEGARVDWERPTELRSFATMAQDYTVMIIATGTLKGIELAVARFKTLTANRATVEVKIKPGPRHARD